ncbi:hypothetical protein ACNKHS_01245 [Shigella flexneri]
MCRSIHFDSAWVLLPNSHQFIPGKSGISGERVPGKAVFETQSTHKMLGRSSQAGF